MDKNVTRKRVSNQTTINYYGYTFYTFLHHEKSKLLLNVPEKISSGLVLRYFETKSIEG